MVKLKRPSFWEKKNIFSLMLLPFSIIYYLTSKLRFFFISPYISKSYTICIGNATIGGSGKTPTVIALAKYLNLQNKNFCVVSRGYKGKITSPTKIDLNIHTVKDVGDEPIMLAKYCPVIIASNRVLGTKFAENLGYDIILYDDGLQNSSIKYNISIMIFSKIAIGNNFLFPAGPLRESLSSLMKRVDYIFTSETLPSFFQIFNYKTHYFSIKTNYHVQYEKNYILFAGIANPHSFFKLAKKIGCKIKNTYIFPDHHLYSFQDINNLLTLKKDNILLTTEKDYIKFDHEIQKQISYLPIKYVFQDLSFLLK